MCLRKDRKNSDIKKKNEELKKYKIKETRGNKSVKKKKKMKNTTKKIKYNIINK